MSIKVFGGMIFKDGKQVRCIVATKSQRDAAILVGTTISDIRNFWSVTGNDVEVKTAMADPDVVFVASSSMGDDFKRLV